MKQLSLTQAQELLMSEDINQLNFSELLHNIKNDPMLQGFSPDGICQIDPRNGNLVIYNSARAKRVHTTTDYDDIPKEEGECPICSGKSSQIFDLCKHSQGFSFVNKNIYPIFHPIDDLPEESSDYFQHQDLEHKGRASYGFHLLQWTSSIHDKDWFNMPFDDALLAFKQLAKLEANLLHQPTDFMSRSKIKKQNNEVSGYVSIIKNYGAAAGASLTHGHQQIAYSNILPQRFYNNLTFRKRNKRSFSQFMLDENPNNLQVKDYGKAVLIVPYFMKRPLDMKLIIKDTNKRYLHQLNEDEMKDLTLAIQQAMRAIIELMKDMGISPAFNMIINNGPGCGLYIEFIVQTQKMGGYEQIGLYVCQSSAAHSAEQLRERIALF